MSTTTPEMGQQSHVNSTDVSTQSTLWTPAHHAKVNKTKPIRLLELGEGEHGKNARFEFPEGWQRTIDLPTQADAYHPLFSELSLDERQKLHRHVQQPVVIAPDGQRKQRTGLSFTTRTLNKRGHSQDFNHFDVPAEVYGQSRMTGYRCAKELLDALRRGYGPHIPMRDIIKDAVNIKYGGYPDKGQWGAACTFINVVEQALLFLAKNSQYADWIDRAIKYEEECIARGAERDAQEKAAFVERMRKARAAKRAARQEGGNHGRA